jgi:hypothetical protein
MAVNKLIATNFAAITTFEHERRREIQIISASQREGKYLGRKTIIIKELIKELKDLKKTRGTFNY